MEHLDIQPLQILYNFTDIERMISEICETIIQILEEFPLYKTGNI